MKKTALITGASSGIGLELAKIFARNHHNLVLIARREDRLLELKEELESEFSITVYVFSSDLSEPETPNKLIEFTRDQNISIDFLVNNAGIGDYGLFHEADWERQKTMIDLNITALTCLTHLYLPEMMKKERTYILNVASTAAFQPGPLMSVYYATKHYVLAFSEAIANELKDSGVSVTALCPGPTQSEFQERAKMEKIKLFNLVTLPSSEDVAEYGYRAMLKGKRVAVHGFMNRLLSIFIPLFPRKIVTSIVRKIQSSG